MRQKRIAIILLLGLLSVCPFLVSSDNYKVVNGPPEFYYGHISLVDIKNDGKDPLVLREGMDKPELAVLNLPLGPGDTIWTSGERWCEIQFDNATILRLDTNTELKIETIMAQSLSSMNKISNLVLRKGRIYVMYKEYNSKEMFQVLTANAAVKLKHNTVTTIGFKEDGSTDVQVEYGKVTVLFGSDPSNLQDKAIYKNERFTVLKDNTFVFGEYAANTDFETWNKEINKNFLELHKGISALPKPIQRLPKAVFYFAQTFGNLYGEWVYDDFYGYVWRPYYNDYYPWGSWQPYYYGQWADYAGQMYWVPDEPWGWVPYHLGVWQWDAKKGWLWLPGSAFAPAWVDWAFFAGSYYSWRPWSMWDWMWYDNFYSMYGLNNDYYFWRYLGYWNYPSGYLYSDSGVGVSPGQPSSGQPALRKISKDQLQKPGGAPLPRPKEMNKAYKMLREALKRGDKNALASLKGISKHSLVVSAQDLNMPKIQGRAVRLEPLMNALQRLPAGSPQKMIANLKPRSPQLSNNSSARTVERFMPSAEPKNFASAPARRGGEVSLAKPRPVPSAIKSAVPVPASRIHDWNPDARILQRLGANMLYSSRLNEIYSPQLHISSSMVQSHPLLRVGRNNASTGGASAGSSSGGSSSAGTASTGSSSGSSSSGSSSSSGGGGHIRH